MRRRNTERHDVLRQSDLFAEATDDQLEAAAALLTPVRVRSGQVLVRQGGIGSEFLVLVDGEVDVNRIDGDGVTALATLGSGDFVGEMALLSGGRRNGDVVAVDFCRFLVLERRDFNQFTARHPALRAAITSVAEERRSMNLAPPIHDIPVDQRSA